MVPVSSLLYHLQLKSLYQNETGEYITEDEVIENSVHTVKCLFLPDIARSYESLYQNVHPLLDFILQEIKNARW